MQRCVRFTLLLIVLLHYYTNVYSVDVVEKEYAHYLRINKQILNIEKLIQNYKTSFVYQENEVEINRICDRDFTLFQQALQKGHMWALKMLDASSKLPSGILQGNIIDLGMYDECVAIYNVTLGIRGHHCMYTPIVLLNKISILPSQSLTSMCLPESCGAEKIIELFHSLNSTISIQLKNLQIAVSTARCSTVHKDTWNTELVVCSSIIMTLVTFLVGCSFYDALSNNNVQSNIFKQFSLQRNAAAILSTEIKKDNLPIIHGLRVLSMAWVVLGHEFLLNFTALAFNKLDVLEWIQSWTSLYIFTAPFAVDTFFTVSGFLMTYLFFKQMSKRKTFNVFIYYIHRYIRLTPTVAALLTTSTVFLPKIGSGARWDTYTNIFSEKCREKWWPTLLYVQNFFEKDNICMAHLWYLAVDMQLFWISPFILYPLHKMPKIGLGIITILISGSLAVTALLIATNEYPVISFRNQNKIFEAFQEVYEMPYVRAGPWLLGIFLGYEIANNNQKLSKTTAWKGWLITAVCFSFCIIGTRYFMDPGYKYDVVAETIFATISRPIWALGICWIIYASVNGRAGIVQKFLNWRGFLPLSRISYCVYLVHFVIQTLNLALARNTIFFNDYFVWRLFFGDLITSLGVAFFFSLLFESPVLVLEKMILQRSS